MLVIAIIDGFTLSRKVYNLYSKEEILKYMLEQAHSEYLDELFIITGSTIQYHYLNGEWIK